MNVNTSVELAQWCFSEARCLGNAPVLFVCELPAWRQGFEPGSLTATPAPTSTRFSERSS